MEFHCKISNASLVGEYFPVLAFSHKCANANALVVRFHQPFVLTAKRKNN